MNVWRRVPFTMIIFLAGLQSVPQELNEAAAVDGAGSALRTFAARHAAPPARASC